VTQRRGGRTRSENESGTQFNETAIDIYRHLGPGLLESVYEVVLAYELSKHGLAIEWQVPIAIVDKGIEFEDAFRADLIIDGKVIIERECQIACGN
jgi:GxxExxY protein